MCPAFRDAIDVGLVPRGKFGLVFRPLPQQPGGRRKFVLDAPGAGVSDPSNCRAMSRIARAGYRFNRLGALRMRLS